MLAIYFRFVESENDPANDPMVVWYNGGPGCSSLTGFLVELGPWRVNPDGSGLHWFEHRWNKVTQPTVNSHIETSFNVSELLHVSM